MVSCKECVNVNYWLNKYLCKTVELSTKIIQTILNCPDMRASIESIF